MKSLNVLISGAGIAGPSLAYWLHRSGHHVTIVERAHHLRTEGYAVDVRGSVIEVLRRMGVLEAAEAAQTRGGTMYLVDEHGKQLAPLPSIVLSGELEILRGDLGKILYDLTKDKVSYIFGDLVTAVMETPNGVHVTFQHAKPQTFDVVVGADGTRSNVRELVFGDHAKFIKHLGYGISFFAIKNYLQLDHSGLCFASPNKLAVVYSARDNASAIASLYFAMPSGMARPDTADMQKQMITSIFAQEAWEVPELLKAMQVSKDFYFDTVDQVCMTTWHKGRVVLLGDAAYCASPLSGTGTGLALMGAYVLANELNRQDDLTVAFAHYQQAMLGYVKKAQKLPNLLGPLIIPKSRVMLGLRILLLRIVALMRLERLLTPLARLPSKSVRLTDYNENESKQHSA